jgi:hypothetical protein
MMRERVQGRIFGLTGKERLVEQALLALSEHRWMTNQQMDALVEEFERLRRWMQ